MTAKVPVVHATSDPPHDAPPPDRATHRGDAAGPHAAATHGGRPAAAAEAAIRALSDAYLAMVAAIRGGRGTVGREPDLSWGVTPLPLNVLNRVMRPRLPHTNGDPRVTADVDRRVGEIVRRFDAARVPSTWWLDPATTPGDLAEALARAGYVLNPVLSPNMTRSLEGLPDLKLPPGATIAMVRDRPGMAEAQAVAQVGMGMAPARAAKVGALMASLADPGSEVRTVVVRMGGRVVSSNTSVKVGDDVALFSLATLPEYRGRGLGPATQVFLMQDAAARGAKRVSIESSAMGHDIYARLGFEDVGESQVFWRRAGGPRPVDRVRRRMRRP